METLLRLLSASCHKMVGRVTILVLVGLVAAACAEDSIKPTVEVLTEKTFVKEDGYNFEYKTSDGVSRKEEGELITVGDNKGIGVKGSYSYTAPDGQQYTVTFVADDKGYRPEIYTSQPQDQNKI